MATKAPPASGQQAMCAAAPRRWRDILDDIGDTPLIEMDGVFVKCEFVNPSGSIKARLARYVVERAEAEGLLKPGDVIVEATSGNTGNALAMVAAVKGYRMKVVMPSDFSQERVAISRAFGAEVELVGKFDVTDALNQAVRMGEQPGYWCPRQFDNEWNVDENREWLGRELLAQIPEGVRIDALVQGVGTGGTIIGVSQALREHHNPDLKVFAMEPDESASIKCGEFCQHLIEGIADGFLPGIYQRHQGLVDDVITVPGQGAVDTMRHLAARHGLFVGPSSGANWLAAQEIRRRHPELRTVLTFFCDEGEKYLLQHYRMPPA